MNIIRFQKSSHLVYIPEWAVNDQNLVVTHDYERDWEAEPESYEREFFLDGDRWFIYDHGTIIRFKKSQEGDARRTKFEEAMAKVSKSDPETARNLIESAARLVDLDLRKMVSKLETMKQSEESYVKAYERLISETK
jgi:hypothetical protein